MALLFCDSFDHYDTSQITRKWQGIDGSYAISAGVGRNSTAAIVVTGNFGQVGQPVAGNPATVIVGGAYKFSSVGTAVAFLLLYDSSTQQLALRLNTDGSLSVLNGSGAVLTTTSAGIVPSPTAVFNYIELKTTINNSTGTVTVKVNGVSVISLTGQDTQNSANAYVTAVRINAAGYSGNSVTVDDFYICDTSGATNNDFLGDVRIECKFPDGAGTTSNFAPSAGSNYQCVDETPANDDTDYVSSSTVSNKDTYNFAALSASSGSIKAVAVVTTDRKDDAGTRTHSHRARLSGTETTGTAFAPTTSYLIHQSIFETKPGGGAWTITDVNNAEFGHEVTT